MKSICSVCFRIVNAHAHRPYFFYFDVIVSRANKIRYSFLFCSETVLCIAISIRLFVCLSRENDSSYSRMLLYISLCLALLVCVYSVCLIYFAWSLPFEKSGKSQTLSGKMMKTMTVIMAKNFENKFKVKFVFFLYSSICQAKNRHNWKNTRNGKKRSGACRKMNCLEMLKRKQ